MIRLVVGLAIGAAVTALVFVLWPRPTWQEKAARQEAQQIACNLAPGIGVACEPILEFRKVDAYHWDVEIPQAQHRFCFRLSPYEHPQPRACASIRS